MLWRAKVYCMLQVFNFSAYLVKKIYSNAAIKLMLVTILKEHLQTDFSMLNLAQIPAPYISKLILVCLTWLGSPLLIASRYKSTESTGTEA